MVDIHSHILWQLDDGARSFEESVAMLRAAEASGTTDIVATPHANNRYRFDPDQIAERIAALSRVPHLGLRIHRGCDFHLMYENVVDALGHPAKYTINGGPYLLAELPDSHVPPPIDTILDRLLANGLIPIITHPERNPAVSKDAKRLSRWVDMGCLIQITAGSLTGIFGTSAQRNSEELLRRELVHVIASDAHDPTHRHPCLHEACDWVAAKYGQVMARILFESVPGAIIAGQSIDIPSRGRPLRKRRKPWLFFRSTSD